MKMKPRQRNRGHCAIWCLALSRLIIGILVCAGVVRGSEHETWSELLQRADSLWVAGEYDANLRTALRAVAVAEEECGPFDTSVARVCNALGDYYRRAGAYEEARQALVRALTIRESALGSIHPDVAETCDRFGILCAMEGRSAESEQWHDRAWQTRQTYSHGDHVSTADACYNVGSSYYFLGRPGDAELHLLRAREILARLGRDDVIEAVPTFSRLGQIYCEEGRFDEAEVLLEGSLTILERSAPADSTITARTLDNLATLYRATGRPALAATAYRRAISIIEMTDGPSSRLLIGPILNLADLSRSNEQYNQSEQLYRRTLKLAERWRGESSPSAAYVLLGLAGLLDREKRYDESEQLYDRILRIDTSYFGYAHSKISTDLEQLSVHLIGQGNRDSALALSHRALLNRRTLYGDNAWGLSEHAALQYSRDVRHSTSLYLDLFLRQGKPTRAMLRQAAEAIWFVKGAVTDGVSLRRRYLATRSDDSTAALLGAYRYTKRRLSELFARGAGFGSRASYERRLDSLQQNASALEAGLARSSAAFRQEQENRKVDFGSIPTALPDRTLLVEYLRYDDVLSFPDSTVARYLLLLVQKTGPVCVTDLGEASVIDNLVERYQSHMITRARGGSTAGPNDMEAYQLLSRDLYRALLGPVDAMLDGVDRVFVAPDGSLSLVSFAALTRADQRYVVEDLAVHYLASGRDLLRMTESAMPSAGLLAVGDADFDAAPECRKSGEVRTSAGPTVSWEEQGAAHRAVSDCRQLADRTVLPLPFSRNEVKRVARLWQEQKSGPVIVLTGCDASEDRLKSEAPGKEVIHVATHGYFLGGPCRPTASTRRGSVLGRNENPLLLSGLLLAGANRHGEGAVEAGVEDGILTAEEVADLSLDGTRLVVLSACESGLGEVEQGEGVYGLRHAFQIAGARTVVSALWQISDASALTTTHWLFMHWEQPIFDRLRSAELQEIARLRARGQPDHPVSWGAFITQGDWR